MNTLLIFAVVPACNLVFFVWFSRVTLVRILVLRHQLVRRRQSSDGGRGVPLYQHSGWSRVEIRIGLLLVTRAAERVSPRVLVMLVGTFDLAVILLYFGVVPAIAYVSMRRIHGFEDYTLCLGLSEMVRRADSPVALVTERGEARS
jgi:hypothetical protein